MTKIEIMSGGIFTAFRDPVLFSTSVIIKKAFFVMYLSWKLKDLLRFYDKSEVLLSKAKPMMHENPFLSFFVFVLVSIVVFVFCLNGCIYSVIQVLQWCHIPLWH